MTQLFTEEYFQIDTNLNFEELLFEEYQWRNTNSCICYAGLTLGKSFFQSYSTDYLLAIVDFLTQLGPWDLVLEGFQLLVD